MFRTLRAAPPCVRLLFSALTTNERMRLNTGFFFPLACLILCFSFQALLLAQGEMPEDHPEVGSEQTEPKPIDTLHVSVNNGTDGVEEVSEADLILISRQAVQFLHQRIQEGDSGNLLEMMREGNLDQHEEIEEVFYLDLDENGQTTLDLSGYDISHPLLLAEYKGGVYENQIHGETEKTFNLTVYEPSRDKDVLEVETQGLRVRPAEDDAVRVEEMYGFNNTSDRAYIGEEGASSTINVPLPGDATSIGFIEIGLSAEIQDVQADDEGRIGFGRHAITPETPARYAVQYEVPIEGRQADLGRTLGYDTNRFLGEILADLFDVQTNLDMTEETRSWGTRNNERSEEPTKIVEGQNLNAGQQINLTLQPTASSRGTGGGQTGEGGSGDETFYLLAIALLSLVALLMSGYALFRNSDNRRGETVAPAGSANRAGSVPASPSTESSSASSGSPSPSSGDTGRKRKAEDMRQFLIEEIARLDRDLEEGNISEDYHRERRRKLKERLLEIEGDQE